MAHQVASFYRQPNRALSDCMGWKLARL